MQCGRGAGPDATHGPGRDGRRPPATEGPAATAGPCETPIATAAMTSPRLAAPDASSTSGGHGTREGGGGAERTRRRQRVQTKMSWCSLLTVWYSRPLGIKVESCPVLQ